MLVAIALFVLIVGSVLFHLFTPWWHTPIASNWGSMDLTIDITFWITGVAYTLIILFTAWCVYRFRQKPGQMDHKAEYEPENKKLELWLTIGTAVGVAGLLAPGLIVWGDYVTVPKEATRVEVVGQQWQWAFRYPGADGKLGKSDISLISGENPYGLDPNDANGQDDVLVDADNLHLVVNQPVDMLLRSIDVLHDFYVPQFRAKMDLVPGLITFFWLRPTRTGEFDILCAELCGSGHHAMRGRVVIEEKDAFDAWIAGQETFAQRQAALRNGTEGASSVALNAINEQPSGEVVR